VSRLGHLAYGATTPGTGRSPGARVRVRLREGRAIYGRRRPPTSRRVRAVAGTVGASLVFTNARRLAFTFGPNLDIKVSGGTSAALYGMSTTLDEKVLEIGAQAGLVVTL
jgi:hypothetical protein